MHDEDDPHRRLHDDVRLLGELLGEALRDREGPGIYALATRLEAMPVEAALPVARAFAHFLTLANIAEQYHRIRRRHDHQQTGGEHPQAASPLRFTS